MKFIYEYVWNEHLGVEIGYIQKDHKIGKRCVGLQQQGKRPIGVEFSQSDLEYLFKNPDYLKHLLPVLRKVSKE